MKIDSVVFDTISKGKFSFIDWFLPFFLILAQYSIFGFSNYGIVILILYALMAILTTNSTLYINKYILFFIISVSILQIINQIRISSFSMTVFNNLLMQFILIFIFAVFLPHIHQKNLFKSYSFIGIIAMIIMFYQAIRLFIFKIPAIPITFLPVSPHDAHYWGFFNGLRPSSLFTEPQAYASFMIPLLILALKYKKLLFSFLISLSILLCTSSQGILLVAFIFLYTILFSDTKKYIKIFSFLFICIGIYAFFNLSIFSFALKKLGSTEIENNVRLTRGFIIYSTFNLQNMLFGIGTDLKTYVLTHLSDFPWANIYIQAGQEHLLGYATTVAFILIQFGFIGGAIFFWMLFKMYKYYDKSMRLLLITIFILSFTQTILFNAWFILYFLTYMGCCDESNFDKNYIMLNIRTQSTENTAKIDT
jgi:hypothetical protein